MERRGRCGQALPEGTPDGELRGERCVSDRRRRPAGGQVLPTCASRGQVIGHGVGERDVAVPPLVADPPHLRQHPHGLLARLRLHRVTCQVWVTTVTSLELLLLTAPALTLTLDLVKGVVLVGRGRSVPEEDPRNLSVYAAALTWECQRPRPSLAGRLRA